MTFISDFLPDSKSQCSGKNILSDKKFRMERTSRLASEPGKTHRKLLCEVSCLISPCCLVSAVRPELVRIYTKTGLRNHAYLGMGKPRRQRGSTNTAEGGAAEAEMVYIAPNATGWHTDAV